MTSVEKARERTRRFRERHPNYAREKVALYRKTNPKQVAAVRARMKERRDQYVREAKDKPCADCGVRYPYFVMDFDHVRGEKSRDISQLRSVKLKTIQEEIDKCDVVCSNCHRVRTHEQGFC